MTSTPFICTVTASSVTPFGGKATTRVMKDVLMFPGYSELEIDIVADNPGNTLFHCHGSRRWTLGL